MGLSDLQSVVNDVADRLGAPTVVEDRDQRMVAYSAHGCPTDEVRRDCILRRETPPDVMRWFRGFGILGATTAVRIPSHPELGILGRLCAPARYRGRLMGFLWLIDDEGCLDDAAVSFAEKAAEHAGLLMYEEELARRLAGAVLSHLLSPSEELRDASARQIVDEGMFPPGASTVAVVVQPVGEANGDVRPQVAEAMHDVGQEGGPGDVLRLTRRDHGVLLVPLRSPEDDSRAVAVGRGARDTLLRRLGRGHETRVVVALGDPQPELSAVVLSYRQARLAAKVASVIPITDDLTRWCDLGAFRALAQLPSGEAAEWALDPRLDMLLRLADRDVVETLETYLDLGCDAKSTADRLHLHRGTLYYRLNKVRRLTGVNLRDGNDRLALHLGFKLSRLTGLHPSRKRAKRDYSSPRPSRGTGRGQPNHGPQVSNED